MINFKPNNIDIEEHYENSSNLVLKIYKDNQQKFIVRVSYNKDIEYKAYSILLIDLINRGYNDL